MMPRFLSAVGAILVVSAPLHAINVSIVYQDPNDSFFSPTAKATLSKAAADISFAITSSLAPLNSPLSFTGTAGQTEVTADWSFEYDNPNTGENTVFANPFFGMDEFIVVVGRRDLEDDTLGVGGPAATRLSLSGSGFAADWVSAVEAMEDASNPAMVRGGPISDGFEGDFDLDPDTPAQYVLDYGYTLGTLTFDDEVQWHFDYNSLPSNQQDDFYSVAVHEMIHAIGFGIGFTWNQNVVGTNWLGDDVITLLGTGVNVLADDQAHIKNGLTGRPLIDGQFNPEITQDAIMDPSLTQGQRKYITDLDLAFLEDMGWQVVPEPSTNLLLISAAGGLLLFARCRKRKS